MRDHEKATNLPKRACRLINEGFVVGTNVRVLDRSENTHFIEGILFLLVRQFAHFDFLESVGASVAEAHHGVDAAVGTLTLSKQITK